MSFLSSVTVPKGPAGTPTTPSAGGFLGGIQHTDPVVAQQQQEQEAALQVSKANSEYANSFIGLATNTIKGLPEASGIPQQFKAGVEQANQGAEEARTAPGAIRKAEGVLNFGSGLVTAAFSPLAPVFAPVNKAIEAAGEFLSNSPAMQAYGRANANVPADKQTTAERVLTDIINAANVSLAALGSAKGALETPKVKGGFLETTLKPEVTPETPNVSPNTQAVPKTLKQTHAEYARSQGYEPFIPEAELPVIDFGKKGKSALPEIQTEVKAPKVKGDLTVEPIKETPVPNPNARVPFSAEAPAGTSPAPLKPATSLGPTKISTLGKKVEANAIANKLTTGLGDLPEYNKVSMKEQAQFAADLVNNEPDKAFRIAMGQEAPPAHILPEAVFTAVEEAATQAGDIKTLQQLGTKSALVTQATAMGQRIRALAERDELSPVKILRDLAAARAPKRVKLAKEELDMVQKTVKTEVKKIRSGRQSYEDAVKDILCNF